MATSIYQENYDEFTDKVQIATGIDDQPEPEFIPDPYDVTFSTNYGDSYEYIRRYSTLESPVDIQNGIIDKFLIETMLNVDGNTSILGITTIESSGFLDVNSNSEFAGINTFQASGFLDVNSNADFAGITTIASSGYLDVNSGSEFAGINTFQSSGFLDVNSNADFAGITTISNTTNSTSTTSGALQVKGGLGISLGLNVGGSLAVSGISTFTGNAFFNGNINLGDASTDDVVFNAEVNSNIIPNTSNSFDLGSSSKVWRHIYSNNLTINGIPAFLNGGTGWFGMIPNVATDGVMEIGKFLDFHVSDGSGSDFDFRFDNTSNGQLTMSGTITVNGAITPSNGNSSLNGIYFPPNPGDGGGDEAWIRYYVDGGGENTRLHIRCANDGDDDIFLEAAQIRAEGAFSKFSGSFRIPHPLPELTETHELVHSFVEGPRADLIYRGKASLNNGISTIQLDEYIGITTGTWNVLCRDPQVFLQNNNGWDLVRGSVSGNILTIESQNITSTDEIDWLIIAERKDQHMYDTKWTDENGRPILEPLK